jgi:cation diffusion facilitator CzcD-associated flavoprotein CzcO
LAVASHLRDAGLDVRIFGKPMDFWDTQMPRGMMLRSPLSGSDIADPQRALTLDSYLTQRGVTVSTLLPLEEFIRYGQWFQRQSLPDLDRRHVARVERAGNGFHLVLEDDDRLCAERVVIATGIGSFPHYPAPFAGLPQELVSHTCERINRDLSRFSGQRVMVIGGGQSAVESAALLAESGADVTVLVRQPQLRWLRHGTLVERLMNCKLNPFQAPGKIGPAGLNWLVEHPRLFTSFPRKVQDKMAARAIRPAASHWLQPRTQGIAMQTGRHVVSVTKAGGKVHLHLNDGTTFQADHVLLGTGYKVAVSRMSFLAPELVRAVQTVNGYPVLNRGFESSIPGLYFVGATGAYSFGPVCRFVYGTRFAAGAISHFISKRPVRQLVPNGQR